MGRMTVMCVRCGRYTTIEELVPVRLVSSTTECVLSSVCAGCILDVDGAAKRRKTNVFEPGVCVTWGRETYEIGRR